LEHYSSVTRYRKNGEIKNAHDFGIGIDVKSGFALVTDDLIILSEIEVRSSNNGVENVKYGIAIDMYDKNFDRIFREVKWGSVYEEIKSSTLLNERDLFFATEVWNMDEETGAVSEKSGASIYLFNTI